MLSNSNRSPVVSPSTAELSRVLERYFKLMGTLPAQLAVDVFQSAVQLVEFYSYCLLCLFAQDKHVKLLLEDNDVSPIPAGDDKRLYARHEAFLWQRQCPELRRTVLRLREDMNSLVVPEASALPGIAHGLLQVAPFPKLSSPSSLCGLAERCVGIESLGSLVTNLLSARPLLTSLLQRGQQEIVERAFAAQEAVARELRCFVLGCTARDLLESPDVGRVSLEHFSNTVMALKWDTKDFPQGAPSPAAQYVEQIRSQLDELARRIPSQGGGSIPFATQRGLWAWVEARLMQECVEVVAKIGRKKSQEALFVLAEDFRALKGVVQQHFRVDGASTEGLPADNPLATWSYLDEFLNAHSSSPNEAIVWCKSHQYYPLRLHRALLDYVLGAQQKVYRQSLAELELYFAAYIADESISGV